MFVKNESKFFDLYPIHGRPKTFSRGGQKIFVAEVLFAQKILFFSKNRKTYYFLIGLPTLTPIIAQVKK
jgi:hypothetical protein